MVEAPLALGFSFLGLRISLLDRFCPLAMTSSVLCASTGVIPAGSRSRLATQRFYQHAAADIRPTARDREVLGP